MSLPIGGPGAALPNPLRPDRADRASEPADGRSTGSSAGAAAFRDATAPLPDSRAGGAADLDDVASSPSARVDPELWALLGRDERAFYLRNSITSPATYGPAASPGSTRPGARVGVRLDVRA